MLFKVFRISPFLIPLVGIGLAWFNNFGYDLFLSDNVTYVSGAVSVLAGLVANDFKNNPKMVRLFIKCLVKYYNSNLISKDSDVIRIK